MATRSCEPISVAGSAAPLLVYRAVFSLPHDDAHVEQSLARNGWLAQWRDIVYPYHHFHSNGHELLVVVAGAADLQFGGPAGVMVRVVPGDAVVIPAGVAHRGVEQTLDFSCVGAYPQARLDSGQPEVDLVVWSEESAGHTGSRLVPAPPVDPIFGVRGPLLDHWRWYVDGDDGNNADLWLLHELPEEILVRICGFLLPPELAALGRLHSGLRRIVIEEAFRRGFLWARWRFLDRALAYLGTCLALDPCHLPSYDERAIARFNMGDRVGAVRDLDRAMRLARDRGSFLVYQAISFEMRGMLQRSLKSAQEAVGLDPSNARAHFEVAYVLQELPFKPDYEGSCRHYSRALELGYHREYVATFNRGWSREEAGDVAGALKDYCTTLVMNPFFQQAARSVARLRVALLELGSVHQDIAECAREIASRQAAGESPALYSHLYVQMAYDYDSLGFDADAIRCYTLAIEHNFPRPSTLYNSRGWAHERMRNLQLALEDYKAATDCDALFTLGLENRARLKERGGDRDGARDDYELLKRRDPLSVHPYQCISRLHAGVGQTDAEIDELFAALKVNPEAECVEVRLRLAEALCKKDRFADAAAAYDDVLHHYPDATLPLITRAHVAIRLGRLGDAARFLRAACSSRTESPADATASNNLGCVLFCLGDYAGAVTVFSERIAVDPADFKCVVNRGHAFMKQGLVAQAIADYAALHAQYPGAATMLLLDSARESPLELCHQLTAHRLLFRRHLAVETWLNNPGPFIVASPEYVCFGVEEAADPYVIEEEDESDDPSDADDGVVDE